MANYLKGSKKSRVLRLAFSICMCSLLLAGCTKKTSRTSVAISDNKSFEDRKYDKSEPIRPMGNLASLPSIETESIRYYVGYVNEGKMKLEENDEYFRWLVKQVKRDKLEGTKVGFKRETMPKQNGYYMAKIRNRDGTETVVNARIYDDIVRQIKMAERRYEYIERVDADDPISNYEIIGLLPNEIAYVEVAPDDYK